MRPKPSHPPAAARRNPGVRRWGRRLGAGLLLLGLSLSLGVRRLPLDPDYTGPDLTAPLPALPKGPYRIVAAFHEERLEVSDGRGYTRERWAFSPASAEAEVKPQHVDWYRPTAAQAPGPALILLPILAGDYTAERLFARHLARRGLSVVIAHRTHGLGSFRNVDGLNRMLGVVVENQRRVVDWMAARREIDPDRIGCLGLSMGGIQGAMLAGADARIRATVLALAGGDLPFILARSWDFELARRRRILLESTAWSVSEYEDRLRAEIQWDPLRTAPRMDARRTLLILARFDVTVPVATGLRLRDALGNPETILIPSGHYNSVVFLPYTLRSVARFFEHHLGDAPGP